MPDESRVALATLSDGDRVEATFAPPLDDPDIGPVERATGTLRLIVGQAYLAAEDHRNDLGMPRHIRIDDAPGARLRLVEHAVEIRARRETAARGALVFENSPLTAPEVEDRLDALAEMIETETDDRIIGGRKGQLIRQFDDLADQVALAQRKRSYLRARARLGQDFNPWTWPDDRVMRIETVRPLPADFELDPVARKNRADRFAQAVRIFGEAERETRRLAGLLRRLGYKVRRPHPNAQELRIRVREGKAVADLTAAPSPNGLWEALPCPGQNKTQARALARVLRAGWLDRLRADLDRLTTREEEG